MAKSDRLVVSVEVGPLQGRVTMLEMRLEQIGAIIETLTLEARTHCDIEQEEFLLRLLKLVRDALTAANRELTTLKESLFVAAQAEREVSA